MPNWSAKSSGRWGAGVKIARRYSSAATRYTGACANTNHTWCMYVCVFLILQAIFVPTPESSACSLRGGWEGWIRRLADENPYFNIYTAARKNMPVHMHIWLSLYQIVTDFNIFCTTVTRNECGKSDAFTYLLFWHRLAKVIKASFLLRRL